MKKYLDISRCERLLAPVRFEFLSEIDSTNEYLKRQVKQANSVSDTLVCAERQIKGKGTRGRVWYDSPQCCLKFSYRKQLPINFSKFAAISPWIALNFCQYLHSVGFQTVGAKWPNDLLIDGGKLSGMLFEIVSKGNVSYLIAGIGVNLFFDPYLKEISGRNVSFLYEHSVPSMEERTDILIELGRVLIDSLDNIPETFTDEDKMSWSACDVFYQKKLKVIQDGKVVDEGCEMGIDKAGRLMVQTSEGIKSINIGELSVTL